jgi:hypothetical protein
VSTRCEPRFTRDVDVAVTVVDDTDAEALVRGLRARGYRPTASVENDATARLATVRLFSPQGVTVDLLFASSGIEPEVVARATDVDVPAVGTIRVARAEELLAMKVLSMRDNRLQDRLDAQRLIEFVPDLDIEWVRRNLELIKVRGYHRDQDLGAKLDALLAELGRGA